MSNPNLNTVIDVETDNKYNISNEKKNSENEFEYLKTRDDKYKTQSNKDPMVIFYCPFNSTYTKILNYEINDILNLINDFNSSDYFIVQVDNDSLLYEEILKRKFKSEFNNIYKLFDLNLDYCFSPVDELLCFNFSILTNIFFDEIEKYLIQIFFYKNGLYIINKDCCDYILNIFTTKFCFTFLEKKNIL